MTSREFIKTKIRLDPRNRYTVLGDYSIVRRMASQVQLSPIDFDTIKEYWLRYLWAGRVSEITPTSCMARDLSIDLNLKKAPVKFLKASLEDQILGVISGYKTDAEWFRMRGLCVTPEFRTQGVGGLLVKGLIDEARKQNCTGVWTLPRQSAWPFYSRKGFIQKGDWFDKNMEFGPNCYAELKI